MFAKIFQVLDHYRPQTYVLASDRIQDNFVEFWQLIIQHREYDANKLLDEMTATGLTYAGKLWDKIMHVSEQSDTVDLEQKKLHEKYQAHEPKIPNSSVTKKDVSIKGHVHKDSSMNDLTPKVLT